MRQFARDLCDRDMLIMLVLPMALFFIASTFSSLFTTMVVTLSYALAVLAYYRRAFIPLFFSLLASIEWLVLEFSPLAEVLTQPATVCIVSSCLAALLLTVFSLMGKPVPMLIGEAMNPHFEALRESYQDDYQRMWQQINLLWVVAFTLKALLFVVIAPESNSGVQAMVMVLEWPLIVVLIIGSAAIVNRKALGFYHSSLQQ